VPNNPEEHRKPSSVRWPRLQYGFTTLLLVTAVVAIVVWSLLEPSPHRSITLRVKVVDAATGEPVTNFRFLHSVGEVLGHIDDYQRELKQADSIGGYVDLTVPASAVVGFEADADGVAYTYTQYSDCVQFYQMLSGDPDFRTVIYKLDFGERVTRQLTDSETNEPIPGAKIHPCVLGNSQFPLTDRGTTSQADGRFSCSGITRDGFVVIHPGYHTFVQRTLLKTEDESRYEPLLLTRGKLVQGTVTDGNGRPLVGASIECGGFRERKVLSDAKGRFSLRAPYESEKLWLHVIHQGYEHHEIAFDYAQLDSLKISLRHKSQLKLTVHNNRGLPVAGFDVLYYRDHGRRSLVQFGIPKNETVKNRTDGDTTWQRGIRSTARSARP
jgi:hypothetical protein